MNGVLDSLPKGTYEQPNFSYLHERDTSGSVELRLQSAKEGTRISASEHRNLKRNLEYHAARGLCPDTRSQGCS